MVHSTQGVCDPVEATQLHEHRYVSFTPSLRNLRSPTMGWRFSAPGLCSTSCGKFGEGTVKGIPDLADPKRRYWNR